jgi:hypothetical protein
MDTASHHQPQTIVGEENRSHKRNGCNPDSDSTSTSTSTRSVEKPIIHGNSVVDKVTSSVEKPISHGDSIVDTITDAIPRLRRSKRVRTLSHKNPKATKGQATNKTKRNDIISTDPLTSLFILADSCLSAEEVSGESEIGRVVTKSESMKVQAACAKQKAKLIKEQQMIEWNIIREREKERRAQERAEQAAEVAAEAAAVRAVADAKHKQRVAVESRVDLLTTAYPAPYWRQHTSQGDRILTSSINQIAIQLGEAEPLTVAHEQLWTRLNRLSALEQQSLCRRLGLTVWGTKYIRAMRLVQFDLDTSELTQLLTAFIEGTT